MDYLSGWIENLGVVPLFLFAAFLFLPCFAVFFFRIDLVCFVFDAMRFPCVFRALRFHNILCFVKISLLSGVGICTAQSSSQNLYLSKGQQISLAAPGLRQFSVGNPEILGRRYSPKLKKIYLKGKKLGYSDVVVWSKGKSTTYHAYVLSKGQNLKLAQSANTLKGLGLETRFEGKKVWATGLISNNDQLQRLLNIYRDYKDQISLQITLDQKLQKKIIAEIYLELSNLGQTNYYCKIQNSFPLCFYQNLSTDKKLEKRILKDWGVSLRLIPNHYLNGNLKVQFKFIEVETHEKEEFSLGLQKLSSSVQSYLDSPVSLYQNNLIQVNGSSLKMKMLAEPQVQSVLGEKNRIQIGVNVPYQTQNQEGTTNTEWVETGLKVNFSLVPVNGKVLLKYQSELSSPSSERIKTNEQSGSFYPRLNQDYTSIFQIGLDTSVKNHSGPLLLRNIPILGSLLSSHAHLKTYKYFLGYVRITYE